jgi:hypothetical protein
MRRPHPFDFYLYHENQFGAQRICGRLAALGYRTVVREGAVEGQYLCLASSDFVPALVELSEAQALMAEMAALYGGEYDGWQTVVLP